MSSTLTYVYCLVRAPAPPSLRRAPAPVPGGRPVRLIDVQGLGLRASGSGLKSTAQRPKPGVWLAVSSVPARQYGEAALDRGLQRLEWVGARALAHEAVVEHFLSAPAVLPMQLFTLFTSDDRAVAHIAGDRRIARLLKRIEGRVEWGLRVMVRGPGGAPTRAQGAPGNVERRALAPRSGADYLARRRDLREAGRTRVEGARREAQRAYRALARAAVAARRRAEVEQAAPDSRVVLDAAFLVSSGRGRAFQASVRRHTRPLERAGMVVSLTGPWPVYNFI